MEHRVRSLFSKSSIPGWVGVFWRPIYGGINAASNFDWARTHVRPAWDFFEAYGYWLTLVLGLVWLAYLVIRPEHGEKQMALKQEEIPKAVIASEPSWLTVVADDDERQMVHRLYHVFKESEFEANLSAPEPFVDFRFAIVNHSVFDLKFARVDGRVRYMGQLLSRDLEVLSGDLPRGWHKVILRQWLSNDAADHMKTHKPAKLSTGNLGLFWAYKNRRGESKTVRMAFPDDMCTIE